MIPWRVMSSSSTLKGNRYMLRVSRLLSSWWCGTDPKAPARDIQFRTRSTSIQPVEGHWEGKGDILWRPDLEPAFPFAVECKSVEGWTFDQMFTSPKWQVWKWWDQCCDQADRGGAHPLLIFTRAYQPDYVMLDVELTDDLILYPNHGPLLTVAPPGRDAVVIADFRDLAACKPHLVARHGLR